MSNCWLHSLVRVADHNGNSEGDKMKEIAGEMDDRIEHSKLICLMVSFSALSEQRWRGNSSWVLGECVQNPAMQFYKLDRVVCSVGHSSNVYPVGEHLTIHERTFIKRGIHNSIASKAKFFQKKIPRWDFRCINRNNTFSINHKKVISIFCGHNATW